MKPESSSEAETIDDDIVKLPTNQNRIIKSNIHDRRHFDEFAPKRLLFAYNADYTIISLALGVCAALLLFILVLVFVSCRQPSNDKNIDVDAAPNSLLNEIVVIQS